MQADVCETGQDGGKETPEVRVPWDETLSGAIFPRRRTPSFLWSKLPGMQGERTACVAVAQEVESNLLSWIRLWILCCGVWAAVRLAISPRHSPLSLVHSRPSVFLSFCSLSLSRCLRPYNYSTIFRDKLANSLPNRITALWSGKKRVLPGRIAHRNPRRCATLSAVAPG